MIARDSRPSPWHASGTAPERSLTQQPSSAALAGVQFFLTESAQAIATSGCLRRSRSIGWHSPPNRSRPRTFRQAGRTSTGLDRPVHDDDLPSLHRFASHLERDLDAVVAGLTLPWDPGVLERHVSRIKMPKRQMFGRASFALLRRHVRLYS